MLPAEVISSTDACVRAAVAHREENVVFLQKDRRLKDLFAADVHLRARILVVPLIADENDLRVVVLDELGCLIPDQAEEKKAT